MAAYNLQRVATRATRLVFFHGPLHIYLLSFTYTSGQTHRRQRRQRTCPPSGRNRTNLNNERAKKPQHDKHGRKRTCLVHRDKRATTPQQITANPQCGRTEGREPRQPRGRRRHAITKAPQCRRRPITLSIYFQSQLIYVLPWLTFFQLVHNLL